MSRVFVCLLHLLRAASPPPVPDSPEAAEPLRSSGEVSAELGLDLLRAQSSEAGEPALAGDSERIAVQEAGMRLRLSGLELDRRLSLEIDYTGREPIGGDVQNSALRLLYRAELGYALIPRLLTIGLGRFMAPSISLLAVDGARADITLGDFKVSPFGGRRAITTSRRNVPFDRFLPSGGLGLSWQVEPLRIDAAFALSRDEAVLVSASEERVEPYDSRSGFVHAGAHPIDEIFVGADLAFADRAAYVLGPTWSQVEVVGQALDLWSGMFYFEWRPLRSIRLGYDFHTQRTGVFREGLRVATDPAIIETLSDPRFTDHRLTGKVRPFDAGWLRGDVRLRLRPDRSEHRYGGSVDVDHLGVPGLALRGFAAYEDVTFSDETLPHPDLDRLLWSASIAYRFLSIEAEIGASFIDRRSGPLSSRLFDRNAPASPGSPVDLAPFVLEAERLAFLRAFYADERFFGGIDLEQNLEDGNELRVLFQAGLLVEASL